MHLAVQQAVSGQIGFAADTRVYGVTAARIEPSTAPWAAPVVEALDDLSPATPRQWTLPSVGLIRVCTDAGTDYSVGWGPAESGSRLNLAVGPHGLRLEAPGGVSVRRLDRPVGPSEGMVDLQIRVGDAGIDVCLGGRVAFEPFVVGEPTGRPTTVVVELRRGQVRSLEVHSAEIRPPGELRLAAPVVPGRGGHGPRRRFCGTVGPARGKAGASNGGLMATPARRGRHRGPARRRCTGRRSGGPAPPRADRVRRAGGRDRRRYRSRLTSCRPEPRATKASGAEAVDLRQDDDNELIVATWLDDVYDGTSISSFFRLDGYEDLYDAIWTNVGRRVTWGVPYRLRVVFDGLRFAAHVDDELVLYRSLRDVRPGRSPLRICDVGLVANWEWGTDTGSCFRRFTVRTGVG